VDKDGSPSKNPKPVKSGVVPDHLFKYEVEEVISDNSLTYRAVPAYRVTHKE